MSPSTNAPWTDRSACSFDCEKQPAAGRGMVVTNHPLASAAGAEMLALGGNAIDAAICALFTLTVVEPMMVGIFGGGILLARLADGSELFIDGMSCAPAASRPDTYRPLSDSWPDYMETAGLANRVGATAVAVPGTLKLWCEALQRHGRLDLATVLQPAIRHAARGFPVSAYLRDSIATSAQDLANDPGLARLLMPAGEPLAAGQRLMQGEMADTLRTIAEQGPAALYGGALGDHAARWLGERGSLLTRDDLMAYRTIDRQPVRGTYRGVEIMGPPPPIAGGVHVLQMLNLLEAYDVAALGFGTADGLHLLLEAMKIAAADREAATGDPAFVATPIDRLISKDYAAQRRAEIRMDRAGRFSAGVSSHAGNESANTTHVTVADAEGNVVATTNTINSLFGARVQIPGTGIITNNYMYLFDPHPGHALSLQPGKRVTSSMAPLIASRDGRPRFALGLPGGTRIYASALQAVLNLVDHGMSLQQAVEAPRVWTLGQHVEVESGVPADVQTALEARGHAVVPLPHVAGGMCAIAFDADGGKTGAACWRADGAPVAIAGGAARAGTRFFPDPGRPAAVSGPAV